VRPWVDACVGVALIAAAQAACAAEDLVVEVERRGEGVEVRARATVVASVPLVWEVLTDYDGLARFIPGITKSGVRLRQGHRVTVEQSGEVRFLVFTFPTEVTLEVLESPLEWISSHAVRGNVRRMTGRYDLLPDRARQAVLVRYQGLIEPDSDLPPIFGPVALRSTAEEQFTAMIAEIERRAAAAK
jgi:ribosome-associated toxin RatA of RatAB toxin-antitoxin module